MLPSKMEGSLAALGQRILRPESEIQQRLDPEILLVEPHVKQTQRLASRVTVMMEPPCTSMSFAVC
jgi:hypothetical protein